MKALLGDTFITFLLGTLLFVLLSTRARDEGLFRDRLLGAVRTVGGPLRWGAALKAWLIFGLFVLAVMAILALIEPHNSVPEIVADLQNGPRSPRLNVAPLAREVFTRHRYGSKEECPPYHFSNDPSDGPFVSFRCRNGDLVRVAYWGEGVEDENSPIELESVSFEYADGGHFRLWVTDHPPPIFELRDGALCPEMPELSPAGR